jgi:hypothetical protein
MMHGHEKSRSAIVAVKPTNKAERSAAESLERRVETKGNVDQQRTRRTQRRLCAGHAAAFIHWPVTRARWRSRDAITVTPSLLAVGVQIWPSKHSASMTWRGAEMRLLDCENRGSDPLKSLTFWTGCVAGPLIGRHFLTRQRPFAGDNAHCERASHIEPSNIFAAVPCAAPSVRIARI